MWVLTRRSSLLGWTFLEIVGVGVAIFGTLPFAFYLSTLVTSPETAFFTSAGNWRGVLVYGTVALVGWCLLVWGRLIARRRSPAPIVAGRPG